MRSYRWLSAAAFVVVLGSLVGGFFGRNPLAAQDQVQEQYRVFTSALSAVESTYVGEAPSDRLVYSAISGMLQTLDPHSNFMDPRSYAQMREQQEGRYYGLGISIQVAGGDIIIANVFEGSPAFEKGLRRGDVIVRAGDTIAASPADVPAAVDGAKRAGRPSVLLQIRRGPRNIFVPIKIQP